jgi:hypothetical protein
MSIYYLKRQLRQLVTGLSCLVLGFNHMPFGVLVCCEQSDLRAGVSPHTSAFPCPHRSTNAPHSSAS